MGSDLSTGDPSGPTAPAVSRRQFLRLALAGGVLLAADGLLAACGMAAPPTTAAQPPASPASAAPAADPLQRLLDGNLRFVEGRQQHPNLTAARRGEVAATQKPFAVVLACADSRVAPELLFDQGLGDLFVVRVAGNMASSEVLGSIEYAVEHLGSELVMVLGHERCGAVTAAVNAVTKGEEPHGNVAALVAPIRAAVEQVKDASGDLLDNAVKANVQLVAAQLGKNPVLEPLVKAGRLKIAGSRYDLDTGRAELLT